MTSPHPLNHAVIAQALHDLRNGQLRRCRAMGFSARALEALKHPHLVSMLLNAQVSWCSVTINSEVVHRILEQQPRFEHEISVIDRMLRLGASTEMLNEFYGLTHQEVALRREVLGLPHRRGRWPVLTEAQDAALWQCWHDRVKRQSLNVADLSSMLKVSMTLAEEREIPLAVVWTAVREWIAPDETHPEPTQVADRTSRMPQHAAMPSPP
jgi:hypothetical protein